MKHLVFSVFDVQVKAFLPPFMAPTKGAAIRMFSDAVKSQEQFKAHRADYGLFLLAEFDDANGAYGSLAMPEPILQAAQVEDQ